MNIVNILEISNYVSYDFVRFDRVVIDDICRKLKKKRNYNRILVYRKC